MGSSETDKGLGQSGNQLRIALIGGHGRGVRHIIERGRVAGWKVEGHSGVVKGRGTKELRSQIERADIVIITTQINSHGGMLRAKELARRFGRFITIVRRESFAEIENAIAQFQSNSHLKEDRKRMKNRNICGRNNRPGCSRGHSRHCRAAAIVLTTEGHDGKTFNLNCPDVLSVRTQGV